MKNVHQKHNCEGGRLGEVEQKVKSPKPELSVWMISDGRPGHFNQTLGVVRALEKGYDVKLIKIETRLRLGFLRPLLKLVCNSRRGWLKRLLAPLIRFSYYPFVLPSVDATVACCAHPDVIISCGGQTLYLNVFLARQTKARNFFLGSLRGVHPRLFTAIISGLSMPGVPNLVELELSPGLFDAEKAAEAGQAFLATLESAPVFTPGESASGSQKTYWAMLVGGDGAGYQFENADMAALESLMLMASRRYGVRWLLTTSRRTSREHEQRLQCFAQKHPEVFAYTLFYHQKPEALVMAFLGAADKVFATEDSSSMISEAMMSRRPVMTLSPRHSNPNENYRRFLDKHRHKHRIASLHLSGWENLNMDVAFQQFTPLQMDIDSQLLELLQPFLVSKNRHITCREGSIPPRATD